VKKPKRLQGPNSVSFGELLAEYESQKGYGVSKEFKRRRFIEVTDSKNSYSEKSNRSHDQTSET
jgi:hypothetical protein